MRSSAPAPHAWVFPTFIPFHIWVLQVTQYFNDLTVHTLGIDGGADPSKVPKWSE